MILPECPAAKPIILIIFGSYSGDRELFHRQRDSDKGIIIVIITRICHHPNQVTITREWDLFHPYGNKRLFVLFVYSATAWKLSPVSGDTDWRRRCRRTTAVKRKLQGHLPSVPFPLWLPPWLSHKWFPQMASLLTELRRKIKPIYSWMVRRQGLQLTPFHC